MKPLLLLRHLQPPTTTTTPSSSSNSSKRNVPWTVVLLLLTYPGLFAHSLLQSATVKTRTNTNTNPSSWFQLAVGGCWWMGRSSRCGFDFSCRSSSNRMGGMDSNGNWNAARQPPPLRGVTVATGAAGDSSSSSSSSLLFLQQQQQQQGQPQSTTTTNEQTTTAAATSEAVAAASAVVDHRSASRKKVAFHRNFVAFGRNNHKRRNASTTTTTTTRRRRILSLAGPYLIECSCCPTLSEEKEEENQQPSSSFLYRWTFIPISKATETAVSSSSSEGAHAWKALYNYRLTENPNTINSNDDNKVQQQQEDFGYDIQRLHGDSNVVWTLDCRVDPARAKVQVSISKNTSATTTTTTTTSSSNDKNTTSQKDQDKDLLNVLSRVLVQWALDQYRHEHAQDDNDKDEGAATTWTIHFVDDNNSSDDMKTFHKYESTNKEHEQEEEEENAILSSRRALFLDSSRPKDAKDDAADVGEMVEMVDQYGEMLGHIPRRLVHQHNILHRGIGLFVTANRPILQPQQRKNELHPPQQQQQQPDLYVHQRTSTKRIFPSLYDMFVGGVSAAGEHPVTTARREVAEELGLTSRRGLQQQQGRTENDNDDDDETDMTKNHNYLTTCTVCTAYNRCVVDLFCYTMNTTMETIQWQAEEVAWGAFVPYAVIEAAADRSIQRLASTTAGSKWPGIIHPPIQSHRKGILKEQDDASILMHENWNGWDTWDFVPDGLLVWEAWLQWLDQQE